MSLDDEPKSWDFSHFERVTEEMKSGATSVGSMLAAMVYQIERANDDRPNSKKAAVVPKQKDELISGLDQMFMKLAMEQALVETDFKHTFDVG